MRTCLAFLFAMTACGEDDQPTTGKLVALGAVIDQTGSIARPAWRDAAFLAVAHVNSGLEMTGGFHDAEFSLEFADSTNTPATALMYGQELVRERGVKGIVADTSADDIELNRTHYDDDPANDLNVPIICMACTSPNINNPSETNVDPADAVKTATWHNELGWNFRTSADSDPEAVALLNAAATLGSAGDTNGDGTWKISVYAINDAYGNGFFSGFERGRDANYPGLILEKVNHERQVDANTYDWAGDLALLTDDRNGTMNDVLPDTIIEVTFPLFAASITKAYVDAGTAVSAIPFLHHHNWRHDQTLVKLVGTNIDGHTGVSHAILDNCTTSGQTFHDTLLGQTSKRPGFWDAQTYDAVFVLALAAIIAIQDNGLTDPTQVTGAQIRDAIAKTSTAGGTKVYAGAAGFAAAVDAIEAGQAIDYDGPSGPMDFDANGNLRNKFAKFEVTSGDFVDVEAYDCVSDLLACPVTTACPNP